MYYKALLYGQSVRGQAHLAGGIIFGTIAAASLGAQGLDAGAIIAAAGVGCVSPDFDIIVYFARKRKLRVESDFDHHDYITHTPLFYLVLLGVAQLVSQWQGWAPLMNQLVMIFFLGALLHLFMDLFWAGGIMLCWPLTRKKYIVSGPESSGEVSQFTPYRGMPADKVERVIEIGAAVSLVVYLLL